VAEWRVLVAETLTGKIVADVIPSQPPSYERAINEKGSWSVSALVHSSANSSVDLHTFTQTGKYSWVIAYGDHITQAGPVWSYQFDEASAKLTVTGSSLGSFLDKRVLRNPSGHTAIVDPSEDLIYTNRTLRGIMRALVLDNLRQDGYMLPLDLPETEIGTASRTYYGYDLATVWSRMDDLAKVIDGPEFDLQPYFVSGSNYVRWQMLIGGPLLGNQETTAVWDYGGALGSINIDVNGAASPTARVWVKGSGSDRSLLTGFAEDRSLIEQGFPPIDYVDTEHTSVIEQTTLESYADADLKAFRWPTEQWTCSVRIDGAREQATGVEISPALGNWALGDAPTFYVSGHPWLPDGGYRRRITGYADDGPEHVSLTLAETSLTQ
jgi:hypothetical protein